MRGKFRDAPFKIVATVQRRDGWTKEVDYELPHEQIAEAVARLVIPHMNMAVCRPLTTMFRDRTNPYLVQELEEETVHSEIAKIEIKLTYKEI